jgi:hypothetical protein
MEQRFSAGYVFDPADPRAPAMEQWEQMLPAERARVLAMLDAHTTEDEIDELRRLLEEARRKRRGALVMGLEALCDALGIALDAERRAQVDGLDAAGVEALLTRVRRERAWPPTP